MDVRTQLGRGLLNRLSRGAISTKDGFVTGSSGLINLSTPQHWGRSEVAQPTKNSLVKIVRWGCAPSAWDAPHLFSPPFTALGSESDYNGTLRYSESGHSYGLELVPPPVNCTLTENSRVRGTSVLNFFCPFSRSNGNVVLGERNKKERHAKSRLVL